MPAPTIASRSKLTASHKTKTLLALNDQAEPNADGTYTIHFNSPGQKNNVKTPTPFAALLRVYVPKSRQGIIEYLAKMSDALVIR